MLSGVAEAGIPGGSLPLIAGLLATFGIPPEGIGIIIGVDRIMVNVGSDIVTATVVDDQMRRASAAAKAYLPSIARNTGIPRRTSPASLTIANTNAIDVNNQLDKS